MAGSPPALPGFGSTGKSFLIDNLLQSQTPSARPEGTAGGHLTLAACERPRRTWGSEHRAYQSQAHSPQQVKDLGGPLLPHSGKLIFFNASRLFKHNILSRLCQGLPSYVIKSKLHFDLMTANVVFFSATNILFVLSNQLDSCKLCINIV